MRPGDWWGAFDKLGRPISMDTMSELKWARDGKISDYARVGEDQVGEVWVSTVWLGINHAFMETEPVIFETMLFGYSDEDNPCARYCTEDEARAGHDKTVEDLRAGRVPWFIGEDD